MASRCFRQQHKLIGKRPLQSISSRGALQSQQPSARRTSRQAIPGASLRCSILSVRRHEITSYRWIRTTGGASKPIIDENENKNKNSNDDDNNHPARNQIRWETVYRCLMEFRREHGHANVPQQHLHIRCDDDDDDDDTTSVVPLGKWLDKQRQMKLQGSLAEERRERLEAIGVVWNIHDWKWESMVDSLRVFSRREGHANVPQDHVEGGSVKLGAWLKDVRRVRLQNKLDVRRVAQLEDTGVVWDIHAWKWDNMYRLLLQFHEREGHWKIQKSHKEDGENLGGWAARQRELYRAGRLDDHRYERLKTVGFWNVSSQSKPNSEGAT